ncbi:hypothetical protein D6745_01130 [Candidatus Woesearchaeota archaeon]|nr:MAG: hypothetical protein D6745_01130 [Candidatus Woesearchaeota archaeon]
MTTILVFCAHSDDQIFGLGGTLAKYAEEGARIYTYIFSFGEQSHPWLKRHVSVEMRKKESEKADKVIKGSGVRFFDLREGHFLEDAEKKGIKEKVKDIIKKKKPDKIFIHSEDDPHPDHKAINSIILDVVDSLREKIDVYSFDVWNPVKLRKRDSPKMVVDTSSTFKTKINALKCFASQKMTMIFLLVPGVYLRDFFNGLNNHARFAEVFRKVR